jgi:hypothetical protein
VIDVSGVPDPAPQGVYRTERWSPASYVIPNLTPGGSYTVRLHFAETAFKGIGQRHFNVVINGVQVLTNYDIYADAGVLFKATEQVVPATADDLGTIAIDFTAGTGAPHTNPSIRGIEVIPAGSGPMPGPTAPTGLTTPQAGSTAQQSGGTLLNLP